MFRGAVMENNSYIPRAEHKEFARRMDEKNTRLSKRISNIEEMSQQLNDLALSIKELTMSVKNLTEKQGELNKQQKELNERLDEIENRDGEKWRSITYYCLTAVIGAAMGYLFKFFGG